MPTRFNRSTPNEGRRQDRLFWRRMLAVTVRLALIASVLAGSTIIARAALAQPVQMDKPAPAPVRQSASRPAPIIVPQGVDLYLTKVAEPDPDGVRRAGDVITFTASIRNDLLADVIVLPVADVYSATDLQFLSANPPPDSSATGEIRWNDLTDTVGGSNGRLVAGEALTLTLRFLALQAGDTTNTVEVRDAVSAGGETMFRVATAPVTIFEAPTPTPTNTPTETPTATPTSTVAPCRDSYEPDNTSTEARTLTADGTLQHHTFHASGDFDWVRIEAVAGEPYMVTTSNLISTTDTIIRLYDQGLTLLAESDDYHFARAGRASRLAWFARYSGPYYVQVRDFYFRGLCLGYSIAAVQNWTYLPVVIDIPTPTPTPTPSATATGTPTATPSATQTPPNTPTPSVTPTPSTTLTPSVTPTPSTTPTQSLTPSPTPSGPATIVLPGAAHPKEAAVDPTTQRLYVTSRDTDELLVLDEGPNGYILTRRVTVGDEPWGVEVNPNSRRVFVANFAGGTVTVIDGSSLAVIQTVQVAPRLSQMAIDLLADRVFVTSHRANNLGTDQLYAIDGATLNVIPLGSAGSGAWGVAVNEDLQQVYVGYRNSNRIVTFNAADNYRVTGVYDNACGPAVTDSVYALTYSSATKRLYAACSSGGSGMINQMRVFSPSASGLLGLESAVALPASGINGDGGGGIAVNPKTKHVFVTNSDPVNSVTVINGANNTVITNVGVGWDPFGITVDPATGRAFAVNRRSNDVTLLWDGFPTTGQK